jgi:hypothetical protein
MSRYQDLFCRIMIMLWHLVQSRLVLKDELVEVPHRGTEGVYMDSIWNLYENQWTLMGLYGIYMGI